MKNYDYKIEHWTVAAINEKDPNNSVQLVKVNDKAASREAIFKSLKDRSVSYVERSGWRLPTNTSGGTERDWDYRMIAIHHAGRSFFCGDGVMQMREIEKLHVRGNGWADVGYHYGIDCSGIVYEG